MKVSSLVYISWLEDSSLFLSSEVTINLVFFVYSHSSGVQNVVVLVAMIFILDDVFFSLTALTVILKMAWLIIILMTCRPALPLGDEV